ncbi:SHOCT domain-containing protein [bacterium]|nr:SHOCT domain-containing protein [bacterium]
MHGFGYTNWGIMLIGSILLLLVFVGLIFLIVWTARKGKGTEREDGNQRFHTAEDILKARYARGEITREQYLSISEDLSS